MTEFLFHFQDSCGIWETSICKIVHECLDIFYRHFVTKHIYLPNKRQAEKEAQLMHRRSGFPPIAWASVDGTYIKIRCPVIEDALYNCRKFFTSLNVMMFGGKEIETVHLIILF